MRETFAMSRRALTENGTPRASRVLVVLARRLLGLLWLLVIPALAAAVVLRYLDLRALDDGPSSLGLLGSFARTQPIAFALLVFLGIAGLVRYWKLYLPGGRYLTPLPLKVARRRTRAELEELTAARGRERVLRGFFARRLLARRLEPERVRVLEERVGELRNAIDSGDAARAGVVARAIDEVVARVLFARSLLVTAGFVLVLVAVAGAALLIRERVGQSYRVLSASMLPTLQPGDHVLGVKLQRARPAARGEVLVFARPPGPGEPSELVKRVIGLPGDRVAMHGGRPVINGWVVPSCHVGAYVYVPDDGATMAGQLAVEYLGTQTYLTVYTPSLGLTAPYEVKPGEVFVLGDNRNHSKDSRTFDRGAAMGVPQTQILARVDRLVTHGTPEGGPLWRTAFQPLSKLMLNLDGVDTSDLEPQIERCLATRPAVTEPPPESTLQPGDLALGH
jgi:signal peptidase I